jgi:hypothetical protein
MNTCPHCNHPLPADPEPIPDLRDGVTVRGKKYAAHHVEKLSKSSTGRRYLRVVPVVYLEAKVEREF